MHFSWDMAVTLESLPVLLKGVYMTIQLWLVAFPIGMAVGGLLGLARTSSNKLLNISAIAYVEVFRNTPVLIQLIWFYYALPVLTGYQMTAFEAAVLGLTLNTSAYCTEIYRSGIHSISRGQWEGAKAVGMRRSQILKRIIFPQVFKRMLPAFTNRGIELAKMTSLCSVIAVHEIMYQGRLLSAAFYKPFEIFTCVAVIYFLVIYPGSWLSSRLEKKYARFD
ncbi:amino acid ABC transporter permease [Pectobacteriaceae bacterium C52]|uniref:Glutamate/aspartate import permease protein GltK n=1 Tax=Serratia sp. (strain ATCC 39006) TaxID=104623 RepID=A0A2I5T4N1_SERS3|nr:MULTISPECIES: amino acid ABC transporter permease [Enterobacterales]AUG99491.1 amino acid ABC transporter permease [Serratia sp. ATCC 39006]AUH03809.1 amino acid ABC transporter permease [Serratia sp. ATCC 39006]WJV61920.1 amino acid ABC transporter permease [Pectobacteriaceae bacterium C52]